LNTEDIHGVEALPVSEETYRVQECLTWWEAIGSCGESDAKRTETVLTAITLITLHCTELRNTSNRNPSHFFALSASSFCDLFPPALVLLRWPLMSQIVRRVLREGFRRPQPKDGEGTKRGERHFVFSPLRPW
jgi:hypothetical protein